MFTSPHISYLPIVPEPLPHTNLLKENPKLIQQTLPANNIFPHLDFIPVTPRLTGWLHCLHDLNSPSSKWPFNSVQHGEGWASEQQLMNEWAELEWKLKQIYTILQVNPVPLLSLVEEMYPLPSNLGHT